MPAAKLFVPGDRSIGTPEFRVKPENSGPLFPIAGTTKDSGGAALPSCEVHLFRTATDVEVDQLTSDASGNFVFPNVTPQDFHYIVAYLAGSPDVAGTTKNTLTGSG